MMSDQTDGIVYVSVVCYVCIIHFIIRIHLSWKSDILGFIDITYILFKQKDLTTDMGFTSPLDFVLVTVFMYCHFSVKHKAKTRANWKKK